MKVCLTVIEVGAYKLNRIAPMFGVPSTVANNMFKIPLLKKLAFKIFYLREFFLIAKIKRIANKYNVPVTWAVVPYMYGLHSKKTEFSEACPEAYRQIKSYIKNGDDEVIQHGTLNSSGEFKAMNYKEQKDIIEEGSYVLTKMFPGAPKIMQAPKWRANTDTVRALEELKFHGLLGVNIIGVKTPPSIKSTRQVVFDDVPLSRGFFQEAVPLNLVLIPSKSSLIELERWLDYGKTHQCEFIKTSEALQ